MFLLFSFLVSGQGLPTRRVRCQACNVLHSLFKFATVQVTTYAVRLRMAHTICGNTSQDIVCGMHAQALATLKSQLSVCRDACSAQSSAQYAVRTSSSLLNLGRTTFFTRGNPSTSTILAPRHFLAQPHTTCRNARLSLLQQLTVLRLMDGASGSSSSSSMRLHAQACLSVHMLAYPVTSSLQTC